jgi:hypothetical protein
MRPFDASGSRAVEGWRAMLVTGRRCVLLAACCMLRACLHVACCIFYTACRCTWSAVVDRTLQTVKADTVKPAESPAGASTSIDVRCALPARTIRHPSGIRAAEHCASAWPTAALHAGADQPGWIVGTRGGLPPACVCVRACVLVGGACACVCLPVCCVSVCVFLSLSVSVRACMSLCDVRACVRAAARVGFA